MSSEYYIYIPIVVLISIFLLSKAKNKAFTGLFLFWLFGSPIFLNPSFVISLTFFGIDIQPNRFLFLVLTPLLYVSIMVPPRISSRSGSLYSSRLRLGEILLIGYVLIIIFALVLNAGSISIRRAIIDSSSAITFIVVYFCAKKFINNDDFVLFQNAILSFAVLSAIVAIYQFFIDPLFFRLGAFRGAFLDYYRSNGLFTAEYDQGLFLILAIIVAISMNLRWRNKIFLIALLCAGVFVTMHRLSWVAMITTLGLIWFFYFRKSLLTYVFVPLILIIIVIVALNVPWSQMAIGKFGSSLITTRLLADNISGRISQYKFSFDMIKEYPLGIGSYGTDFYTQISYNHGIPLAGTATNRGDNIRTYIIHNGFLSAGVKYGILGLILFSLFIFTSIFDFFKNSIQKGKNWYPLFMIMVVFLVFNLTNDFSFIGSQISMALAWLLGGYVAVNHPNHVGDINIQPVVRTR